MDNKTVTIVTIVLLVGLLCALAFSETPIRIAETDLERYKIELNMCIDKRAKHLKLAQEYAYKMIQLQAVIDYLTRDLTVEEQQ